MLDKTVVGRLDRGRSYRLMAKFDETPDLDWRCVGHVRRVGDEELVATFTGDARVCTPAWEACVLDGAPYARLYVIFAVVSGGRLRRLGQGAVTAGVVRNSRRIADRLWPRTDDQKAKDELRMHDGPRPLRSRWPTG